MGTWDDEVRQAYVQGRVSGDTQSLTALDKLQFLRYRYEHGKSLENYLNKWEVTTELRELCGELAEASGDDAYQYILGGQILSLDEF